MREMNVQRSHHPFFNPSFLFFLLKKDKKTIREKIFCHIYDRRRDVRDDVRDKKIVVVSILINRISQGTDLSWNRLFSTIVKIQRDVYIMDSRSGKYQSKLYNRRETMKAG